MNNPQKAFLAQGARDFLKEQEDQCDLKGKGGEVAADDARGAGRGSCSPSQL